MTLSSFLLHRCIRLALYALFLLASVGIPCRSSAQSNALDISLAHAWAAPNRSEVRTPQTTARLIAWAPQGIATGKTLWLGLQLELSPNWHSYWKNPGSAGAAPSLAWTMPAGLVAGDVRWPAPSKFAVGDVASYAYDDSLLFAVPIAVGQVSSAVVDIRLDANWQVCYKSCVPEHGVFHLQLPVAKPLLADATAFTSVLASLPNTLPSTTVSATVEQQKITFSSSTLPLAWRGKMLNVYPETPDLIPPAAKGQQHWQGNLWQMTLPLEPQQTNAKPLPSKLGLVLALQGQTSAQQDNGFSVIRNAADQPTYQTTASVQTTQDKVATLPTSTSSPAGYTWWLMLGAALLGGAMLNLMPCVFPVLAIKLLGFAKHAHHPRNLRMNGLAYTVGTVTSMVLLAGALLLVRAGGEQLGWGFQLQNPYIVAALAILFTTLALNLAGVFDIALPISCLQTSAKHPVADALLSGLLAVLVASPCSAPFVGASLGFALTLPTTQALVLFASMGLGLALPVLLISFFPRTLGWLPQPGQWMETFRQGMAFLLLAAALWMAWILGQQAGVGAMTLLLALILAWSAMLWALQLTGKARWLLATSFAAVFLVLGVGFGKQAATLSHAQPIGNEKTWQPWSQQRVEQALAAGRPVFVDYSAAWCVTCQINKQTVLDTAEFTDLMSAHNVLLLRADWTHSDPAISASLRSLGRAAVPVYAVYLPANPTQAQILNEILTLKAIKQVFTSH